MKDRALAIANAKGQSVRLRIAIREAKKFVSSRISALSEGRSDKFSSGKGKGR